MNQLIIGALHKRRVDGNDWPQAFACHTRSQCHGMLFCNAHIKVTARKAFGVIHQARAFAHSGSDRDNAWVALCHVTEPLAEDLCIGRATRFFFIDFASGGIKRAGSMPFDGIRFGRCIAFAFAGNHVQELWAFKLANVFKCA